MKTFRSMSIVLAPLLASCGQGGDVCDPLGIASRDLVGSWEPGYYLGKAANLWLRLKVLEAAPDAGYSDRCAYRVWVHTASTDFQVVAEVRTDAGRQLVTYALMDDILAYGFESDAGEVFSISFPLNDRTPYENAYGVEFMRTAVPNSADIDAVVLVGKKIQHVVPDCVELAGYSASDGAMGVDSDPLNARLASDSRLEGRWSVADSPETPEGYAIECD